MLQPSHRGIYEFLWSEHKYPVMAVSLKAFQGMASRLGRRPQLLALLRKIAEYTFSERSENYNALLNAYLHVKNRATRQERHEIIETLLQNEELAAAMIYSLANKYDEISLAGCRLFFAPEHAIFKFWDAQEKPGLWLCFGPMQLHLSPQEVFNRVSIETGLPADQLLLLLKSLRHGLAPEEFMALPAQTAKILQQNNMIAFPGRKKAWLHPRLPMHLIDATQPVQPRKTDFLSAAALTLEKIWDAAEYLPEHIASLPEFSHFCEFYQSELHPAVEWNQDFSAEEAWEFLAHLFWNRWQTDNGQTDAAAEEEDSGAGVGVETADEEIDPEEGEHGDDETCD